MVHSVVNCRGYLPLRAQRDDVPDFVVQALVLLGIVGICQGETVDREGIATNGEGCLDTYRAEKGTQFGARFDSKLAVVKHHVDDGARHAE